MKKRLLILLFVNFWAAVGFAQQPRVIIDIPTQQKPWNNLEWNNAPQNFQFAIVTDRTGGHRSGIFLKGIQKLNLLRPEFVMSVGDLIEGYTEDQERLKAEWAEFRGFIDSLQAPFFYVPGNHDITNQVMEDLWKEMFGVTYYHFVYNDVLFLCLNSEDNLQGAGRGTIDDEQYEYIRKVLEENEDVKWTLVFMHQPLWVQENTKRWKDVEALLKDRNHNVFAGHYHRYWKTTRNNGKYIALATTGGGSRLRGTAYGEFDHVVWVTMTDQGPLLANLLLDGIWDENVVTEELVDFVRNRPYPVKIEPTYLTNQTQETLSATIKITNDSDRELHVKLNGFAHPTLHYAIEKQSVVIPPNDVQQIEFIIENPKQLNLIEQEAFHVEVEAAYLAENQPEIVLENIVRFAPLFKNEVARTQAPIRVDGNLDDWKGATWLPLQGMKGSPFDYTGESDCQVSFATTFDDSLFYIAVKITDDEWYIDEKGPYWQQDGLLLGFDARPQHISSENSGEGRNQEWLALLRTFKAANPLYNAERIPDTIQIEANRKKDNMYLEFAFPISYIKEKQNGDWSTLRLGLLYYDYDANGEKRTEHYWYPAWNAEENIPGSGMFFKR